MQTKFPNGLKTALAALYDRRPMTDAERIEHRRLVAAQAARDEMRRQDRQPDLLEGEAQ